MSAAGIRNVAETEVMLLPTRRAPAFVDSGRSAAAAEANALLALPEEEEWKVGPGMEGMGTWERRWEGCCAAARRWEGEAVEKPRRRGTGRSVESFIMKAEERDTEEYKLILSSGVSRLKLWTVRSTPVL
jgi:hypothetical protein